MKNEKQACNNWEKIGYNKAKEEFEKMILDWQKVPCIDGKEKCHECVNELLTKIKEMGR